MNYADLRSPGLVNGGFRLRLDCAKAISAVEIVSKVGPSGISTAEGLRDFFIECANRADLAAGGSGDNVAVGGGSLDPTQAIVTDGDIITAHPTNGAGDIEGVAVVEGSVLIRVDFTPE